MNTLDLEQIGQIVPPPMQERLNNPADPATRIVLIGDPTSQCTLDMVRALESRKSQVEAMQIIICGARPAFSIEKMIESIVEIQPVEVPAFILNKRNEPWYLTFGQRRKKGKSCLR